MKFIKLTHANMREDVMIVASTVCAFYRHAPSGSTHVMVNGGGMFPVIDTPETIQKKLTEAVSYGTIAKVVDIATKQNVQKEDKSNE